MAQRPKQKGKEKAARIPAQAMAALLLLLVGAVYVNTLGHAFVFDDPALILQNPAVTNFHWGQIIGSGSYRPVRTLTYALNYFLGGEDPFGYHLLNLLLHGINTLLLFQLLRLWGGLDFPAFAGSLLFAVHPVQTAAVAYVSGRKDLLATLFLLLGVYLYTRYRRRGGRSWLLGSLTSGALAMLSKEVALVFPALLVAVELLVVRPAASFPKLNFKALRRVSPGLLAATLLAGLGLAHALLISRATRMTNFWGDDPVTNFGTSLKLFGHYLKLVFWPHPLIADYSGKVFLLSTGLMDPWTWLGGFLLLAFLATLVRLAPRLPLMGLGMSWFLVSLLPVLQLIPFHELTADHFLYLPMVGVALVVTQLFSARAFSGNRLAQGTLALLALLSCWRTIDRNRDWKDSITLWQATYAAAPDSYRANANLGQIYFQTAERRGEGLEMTKRALELAPGDPVALSNFGVMQFFQAQQTRNSDEAEALANAARESLLAALRARPGDGSMLTNLGSVESMLGTLLHRRGDSMQATELRRAAVEHFQLALAIDSRPDIQAAWYNMALVQQELGAHAEAANSLERFLLARPDHPEATLRLAMSRLQSGVISAAIAPLKKSASLQPTAQIFLMLAAALQSLGRWEEAISSCHQGLKLFPEDEPLQRRLIALQSSEH